MDRQVQRSGKGIVRRLAVLLGSAALLLPLAEPVGQRSGIVARTLLAMAATAVATPVRAQTEVRIVSIERQDPTTSPTNADSLKWRITFSETTSTSGSADLLTSEFTVSSTPTMATPPTVTNVQPVNISQSVYDVTVSGGDLASFNGTVTLGIANPNTIQEQVMGTFLTNLTPTGTNDNSYVVDNTAPSVIYTAPTTLTVGTAVTVMPSTTDSDASDHSYSVTSGTLPPGLMIDAATGVISGSPTTANSSTSAVTVTVTDGASNSATASLSFPAVVERVNTAPTVTTPITDQTAGVGMILVSNDGKVDDDTPLMSSSAQAFTTGANATGYRLTSITLHGDASNFSASNGNTATLHSGSRTGTQVADFTAMVSASSTEDLVLTPTSDVTLEQESTYYLVTSNDFGSMEWWTTASDDEDSGAADGWSIADDSEIFRTSTMVWGTSAVSYQITIEGYANTTNTSPTVANEIADQTAMEGQTFSFTFPDTTFNDADGDTLTYTATLADDSALPTWLNFEDTTRSFSGTPGAGNGGIITVRVTASDGTDTIHDDFDIKVGTACAEPNFGTRRQIWTGTVTVEEATIGSLVLGHGYQDAENVGNLDDTSFDIGANSYTIGMVFVFGEDITTRDGDLRFSLPNQQLTSAEVAALKLHVCDTAYDFSSAIYESPNQSYDWEVGLDWSAESTRTVYLSLPANNVATGTPTITSSDGATVGDVLSANQDDIADSDELPATFPNDYTFQWVREDEDGMNAEDISGETSRTYTLTNDDVGKKVRVRVIFIDQLSGMEMRTSDAFPASGTVAPLADTTAPTVTSIERLGPTTSPTNADALRWAVTFSEGVKSATISAADFTVSGTTATLQIVALSINFDVWEIIVSGGNLDNLDGTVTLGFASTQDITDEADNTLGNTTPTGASDNSYVVDNTAPTVTITDVPPSSAAPFTATITFSEVVSGFAQSDIMAGNAISSNFTETTTGRIWTVRVTPITSGEVTLDVGANAARDAAGNGNTAAPQASTAYTGADACPSPAGNRESIWTGTVTVGTVRSSGIVFGHGFRESSGVGDLTDKEFSIGERDYTIDVIAVSAASGNTGDLDFSLTSNLTAKEKEALRLHVCNTVYHFNDARESSPTHTYDWSPNLDWSGESMIILHLSLPENHTATGLPTISSDAADGATVGDRMSASQGAIADSDGLPATFPDDYTFQWIREDGDGTNAEDISGETSSTYMLTDDDVGKKVRVRVSFTDDLGRSETRTSNAYPASGTVAPPPDTNPPQVTSITRFDPTTSPTNADSLTWRVAFSETVMNVNAADFTVMGTTATLSVSEVTGRTGTWDVTASGGDLASLNDTVTLSFANTQGIQDEAGNALDTTTTPTPNNNSYEVDNTAPSVGITLPATSNGPFTAIIEFSEVVNGFGQSAVTVSNGTLSSFTETTPGRIWQVSVTPTADGMVTLDIGAGVAMDEAGNENTAAPQAISTYSASAMDTTAPTVVSITRQDPTTSPTNADSLTWRVAFSETVMNVNAADFTVMGTTATLSVSEVTGRTGTWDVTASGGDLASLNDTVTLSFANTQGIQDEAGNALDNIMPTGTNDNTYEVDNTGPTVGIDVPATSSAPLQATITFNEVVSDFMQDDVTAVNATLSAFTESPTAPGRIWTVLVTPTVDGEVTLDIGAGVATDEAGNGNLAAPQALSIYTAPDRIAPTVASITRQDPTTSPTNADHLTWRVVFSEMVVNVDGTAFTVAGTTATLSVSEVTGQTGARDVTASGGDLADLNGTVTLEFAGGQNIQDEAGNALTSITLTGADKTYEVDNRLPTVMITNVPPTSNAPFPATITFNEPVSDFMESDITAANATLSAFTETTTDTVWTVLVTPTANGDVTLTIPAGVAEDAATNGNTAAPQATSTYTAPADNDNDTADAPAPTVTYTPPASLTVGMPTHPIPPTTGDTDIASYSATGLPAGLMINATTGVISGTPTTVNTAPSQVVVTVTDHSGNKAEVRLTFPMVEQEAAKAARAAQQKAETVLEDVVLPDMIQHLTAETTEGITSRLNTIASGSPSTPPTLSLDDVVADTVAAFHGEREHLKNGSLDWRQVLSGRNFVLPLSSLNVAQGEEDASIQDHPFSTLALWGGGNYSSYSNIIEKTDVDGNGFSAVIGMDLQPIPRLTTGLALTTSRWGLDYATTTNDATAEGTYEIGVTMLNPYMNWLATEQLSLWATVGYGRGEVEQDPEDGNATTSTDGLTSWAGGVRFEVVPGMDPLTGEGAPFGLAFKADGATSSFLDTQVQLARLAAEFSRSFSIEDGLLNAALDLGWRLRSVSDNGNLDGQQLAVAEQNDGSGAELAGRLHWLSTDGSLSATVDTRLLLGGGHHREWGVGGHLRLTPSQRDGEGLSLTLQPSFGITGTRLDELWSLSGNGDPAINNNRPSARLDAELAYGFPLINNAILTPYTEMAWEEAASAYGAGLRYSLNPFLELNLKGVRHHHANSNPENRFSLDMGSDL